MPIRRAPAMPSEEKAPSAAEKDPEASASDESPSADDEPAATSAAAEDAEEDAAETAPTENGDKTEDGEGDTGEKDKEGEGEAGKKELKDGYKYKKSKTKKVKKTIPAWASITGTKKAPVTNYAGTANKVDNILIEALTACNDRSGVSYQSVMKYIFRKYPEMEFDRKKFLIKRAMKKHLEKGTIKQLKGKGLAGTFAIGKQPAASKKEAQKGESLGDALPLIITRLCEPKEASYFLIKKYLEQHFPSLNVENRPDILKAALVRAVEKGQLDQITGKGARGTFQLKRTGNEFLLKGGAMEDAILAAITAMNEPKTCSTTTLKRYLVTANKDRKEYQLVSSLRRTLSKCKVLGWMEQITGHGFTGTYRLSFPFYPSPTILYPDKFKESPKKKAQAPAKKRRTADSSDEESSEEEEESEEESEEEAPVRKRKTQVRPPPKARRPPPAKKSRSASPSKAGRGRGRPPAKKSPAKKAVSTGKKRGRPSAVEKKATPSKATPVKKGSPKKPKTPAVKQLAKRGTPRPSYKESSEGEEEEEAPKATKRGRPKQSKAEESNDEDEDEPAAKKPATKGGSRRSQSSSGPAEKKGAKGAKRGRKPKRGK